ncbi:MAG TPA: response regulator [Bryobacteraceae bacterium]|nr:response regulator [Bryobacteraceae bacterium]
MSRILLADDSPHAQRMGEFILREDGFEVVSVTDGETALKRLPDVAPDLVLADVSLPGRNGYEICEAIKSHPAHRHARVLLTAGAMEPIDEGEAARVQADGSLRKPFEATMMLEMIRPLVESARKAREGTPEPAAPPEEVSPPEAAPPPPPPAEVEIEVQPAEIVPEAVVETPAATPPATRPVLDAQSVRAAVTLALEAALPVLIDEITLRVMTSLSEQDDQPVAG